MNKNVCLAFALTMTALPINAAEHHSGHGNASAGGGGTHCIKAHLSKFTPPHLAKVKPGSEISFAVMNIKSPDQIRLTVKKIPTEFDSEFIDPFYLIKAKLPGELQNTMARIDIQVKAKLPGCEAESGWLVHISEE